MVSKSKSILEKVCQPVTGDQAGNGQEKAVAGARSILVWSQQQSLRTRHRRAAGLGGTAGLAGLQLSGEGPVGSDGQGCLEVPACVPTLASFRALMGE